MFPALYVTESYQTVITESNYSLTAPYLVGDILRRSAGYPRPTLES